MPHAAKMHLAGEGYVWPVEDWIFHLDEEEAPGKIFDALLAVAATLPPAERARVEAEVASLLAEHGPVREGLARGLVPDPVAAAKHGSREDVLVKRYKPQLLAYARQLKRAVRTGADFFLSAAPSPSVEKFIDPHLADCWTRDPGGVESHRGDGGYEKAILSQGFRELYSMAGDQEVGLEYLGDVPNNAAARVAAMRAKIEEKRDVNFARYNEYVDKSGDGLAALLRVIVEAASNPAKATALAASLGIPVAEAEAKRKDILAWLDTPTGSIVKILGSEVGSQVMKLVRQTIADISHEVGGGASSVVDLAEAAPVLGFIVQAFTKTYGAMVAEAERRKNDTCVTFLNDIAGHAQRLSDEGMPGPWHIVDLGLNCDAVVDAKEPGQPLLKALGTAERTDYYQLGLPYSRKGETTWDGESYVSFGDGLTPTDLVALKKWWNLALLLWSDKRVGPVMQTMAADFWGGTLASDEQVMAVAAPIAVSYGFDVDDFARKLWNASLGWRSRPEMFIKRWPGGGGMGVCGVGKIVDNARFIQFAVLARDAFALAEAEAKKEEAARAAVFSASLGYVAEPPPGFIPFEGPSSSLPVLGLGALASGGLYFAGMSLGVVAAPITLAVLYWVVKR